MAGFGNIEILFTSGTIAKDLISALEEQNNVKINSSVEEVTKKKWYQFWK